MSDKNPNRHATFTAADFFALASYLSDTVDLPEEKRIRAIAVGVAGDIVCNNLRDEQVTFKVAAGQILPIQPKRIYSTGTTATSLIGLV